MPLDHLPDDARTWIFAADRVLSEREGGRLVAGMERFVEEWTAHSRELRAGVETRHDRFLLVAVDESRVSASGCSIDALVGRLRELEEELDASLVDSAPVWFRDPAADGSVRAVSRPEFRELAREGRIGPETTVFDLTVARLGGVREGRWELPARGSWHARLLPDDEASDGTPAASGREAASAETSP